ncbi:ornithine cyclodeaminase family protein [Halovenus rubra]|uniref:Alanine dehydrogenase n=2 Tax=Halovenus rubra TaxID=869890 RepID=A0ABD5X9U0_9EURY|nr:ornithine cyclodeaminase family protein [Halovenus rubra]
MQTVILDAEDVTESTQIAEVIDAVEGAFGAYARGDVQMPAKSYVDLPQYDGDFRSMPAYIETDDWDASAVKWVNVHPNNPDEEGLPTVMGTLIYSDPDTGFPLAVMDATDLTRLRTGAAAAVATRHLAREDATSLGLVGAGVQSHSQLDAISQVRDIETVVISDLDDDIRAAFIDKYGDDFDVQEGSIAEAAACDVVSTTTPVRDPIVEEAGDETHINAMGADAEGKHEIADEILQEAKLVIDDHEQCTHSGEINVPWHDGVLDDDDIHGEIGDVVAGKIDARTPEDGVTIFDSTGLAIQDVAAAHVVYEDAVDGGVGSEFDMIGSES